MRSIWLCLLCSSGLIPLTVDAADVLPTHIIGTWETGSSLYDGKANQTEFYLLADGFGMAAGSTAPAVRTDGVDDGKPGPRAIIGFPVQASMNGDTLAVRPLLPKEQREIKSV